MATGYTKETKPSTIYTREGVNSFLLKEDAFYLLLEDGGKIVLSRGSLVTPSYGKETKPTTVFSKELKP